ncbi:hypothetical protein RIF29_39244 [Crotalaria pallida]|uniref:Large ribosomal subunit protein uL15/eL18 domain-containing protein n=1 Tax=Crotalaria pallida TaxID=3830 RepID=A0AAN9E0W0_CROPI
MARTSSASVGRGILNEDLHSKSVMEPVGLGKIARLINAGKIDSSELITMKTFKDTWAIGKQIQDGVRLMGRGAEHIQWPIHLERCSIDHAERVNEVVLKHDHHRLANQIVRAFGEYSLAGPVIWSCCVLIQGKQQDEFPEYVSRARVEHFIEMDSGDKST